MAEAKVVVDNKEKIKKSLEEKRGKRKWALIGAMVVLMVAVSLTLKHGRDHKSCHCSQDSRKYTGIVEDCYCDYETIDSVNESVMHPLLQELVKTPFFRYFKEKNLNTWASDKIKELIASMGSLEFLVADSMIKFIKIFFG